jgi:hypothetical protein
MKRKRIEIGLTFEQFAAAHRDDDRDELVRGWFSAISLEPLFTAGDIAQLTKMNKRDVLRDMKAGRFHDPHFGPGFYSKAENSKKVSASAVNAWRKSIYVPVSVESAAGK